MPSAEREIGGVAVDVIGAGEITDRQPRGFEPADPSDLGDIIAGRESPAMVAFGFAPLIGSAPRSLSVTVSRYTPQPVLVANVEEARYEVVAAEDGKLLVRARYAVRNNQRAFLALRLPPQSTLWSAMLAGRPIRPGLANDGAYLLPLQKGRAGENAPTFAVEVVYLQRSSEWAAKGRRAARAPGGRLAGVAERRAGAPFPTFSGRAAGRRLPPRRRSGSVESRPSRIPGSLHLGRISSSSCAGVDSGPGRKTGGRRSAGRGQAVTTAPRA